MEIARIGNKYLQDSEPWKLIKDEANTQVVADCLFTCIQIVKELGKYAQIFLPATSCTLADILAISSYDQEIHPGHTINKPTLLFEKIEDELITSQVEKLKKPENEQVVSETAVPKLEKPMIQYDDFTKLDLRVGTIKTAEKVKKADRLLHITLEVGDEIRDVVSGIAEHYAPEDIIGKQVTYLANLAPRKLRGIESSGMILMAEDTDGKLVFVSPDEATTPGSVIA
jgi:methionyl-tRNA synthetase